MQCVDGVNIRIRLACRRVRCVQFLCACADNYEGGSGLLAASVSPFSDRFKAVVFNDAWRVDCTMNSTSSTATNRTAGHASSWPCTRIITGSNKHGEVVKYLPCSPAAQGVSREKHVCERIARSPLSHLSRLRSSAAGLFDIDKQFLHAAAAASASGAVLHTCTCVCQRPACSCVVRQWLQDVVSNRLQGASRTFESEDNIFV